MLEYLNNPILSPKELEKFIIKNNGATLDIQSLQPVTFDHGYMVSMPEYEEKHDDFTYQDLLDYVNNPTVSHLLSSDGYYFGIWWDNKSHQFYFDISLRYFHLEDARIRAVYNNQKAIYNLATNEEIRLRD